MLKGTAKEQFTSVQRYFEEIDDGVTYWPEAIQYLPWTYDTYGVIIEDILALRETHKRDDSDERKYYVRL